MTRGAYVASTIPDDATPLETAAALAELFDAAGAAGTAFRMAQLMRREGDAEDARFWTAVVACLSTARLRRAQGPEP